MNGFLRRTLWRVAPLLRFDQANRCRVQPGAATISQARLDYLPVHQKMHR